MADNKFYLDQNEYSLTDEQADIVDAKDKEFPNTNEGNLGFNNWFREFLKENTIKPVNRRMAAYWTSGTKNDKTDAVKLAITLRAMRSMVEVLDPEHKLVVEYNSSAATSSWDGKTKVILPTKPVVESEDLHSAINLEGGYAIHEACHSKHTRAVVKPSEFKRWIEEGKLHMPFANLLEDERIESVEMKENPGFRSYLNTVSESMWAPDELKKQLPNKWEDCKPQDKVGFAIAAIRYPERTKALLDSSYSDVGSAVRKISEEYTALQENATFSDMKQFVDRLMSTLSITAKDESEMPFPEPTPIPLMCDATEHEDDGLSEELDREVRDLVDQEVEELNRTESRWMADGEFAPMMRVYRPKVTEPHRMPKPDNLLNRAKAALTLRKAAPRADERHMLSGEVDEDELARLFMGDMRVFRDITEEVLPSAAVYFLVDCSGSMRCSVSTGRPDYSADMRDTRLNVAQKMAFLLLSSMKDKPNVKCKVLAHTGDNDSRDFDYNAHANFYRIWEDGDDINRLSIIQTMSHGENYDSYAIAWAGGMLAEEDAEQKILIVLSDGEPSGRSYGGSSAMKHVRKHVDSLSRKGIDVLSIAVAPDLGESSQRQMYRHYITARSGSRGSGLYSALLTNLQRVLEKVGSR